MASSETREPTYETRADLEAVGAMSEEDVAIATAIDETHENVSDVVSAEDEKTDQKEESTDEGKVYVLGED